MPYVLLRADVDSAGGEPIAIIKGQSYPVPTEVKPDLSRPLMPLDSAARANMNSESTGYGFDAVYTLRLLGSSGQPLLTTKLRKIDFAAVVGNELLAEAVLATPDFYGYLPKFNALAYRFVFTADGTDWSVATLLLLDATTGKVRHILLDKPYEDMHDSNMRTVDGEVLVTRHRILHAGGKQVPLDKPKRRVAAAQLINGQTVLVVYEPGDNKDQRLPPHKQNAYLLDLNGRQLDRFGFHGTATDYNDGLAFNHYYLRGLRTHFLFDDSNNTLRLMPSDQPTNHRVLPLKSLPKFVPPKKAGEVEFKLRTGMGQQLAFFADTLTREVRYQQAAQE